MKPLNDSEKFTEIFKNIKVIPFDMEKINKAINDGLSNKNNPYRHYKTLDELGYIQGTKIVMDTEAIHGLIGHTDGVIFDAYAYTVNDEGKTVSSEIMPSGRLTVILESILQNYSKEPVTLQEFMGSRFCYNSRILSNMTILSDSIRNNK
jgi:hypothetical protein